ncbi:MAG: transcriptional regulator, IclR family protein [Desulfohalobiaceae bacterium]|nr:transcriptional regulator, IclR family protein [Desulfohalobiaceae bacterium]
MSASLLSRAITIIDAISKSEDGLRFTDLARVLNNPSPATVNKILKELLAETILEKTAHNRYTLGRKVYFWGRSMAVRNTPLQVIKEHMRRLHRDLRVSVNLFACVGDNMLCLESFMDSESPSLWPVGVSLPIQVSILGAIFFIPGDSLSDKDFLQKEIEAHPYPLSLDTLRRMVEEAAATGFQDDFGAFYPGMHRFAVPLNEAGRTVMTLGLGIMPARLQEEGLAGRIKSRLQRSRAEIEQYLI